METENAARRSEGLSKSSGISGQNAARYILLALFAVYIVALIYALFLRSPYDTSRPYWELIRENHSLAPFRMIRSQLRYARYSHNGELVRYGVKNLLGNLVLFLPMGVLLPCIFKNLRRAYKTLSLIMGMVVIAELIQLFTLRGFADIDDLILNTAGAAAGYLIFYLVRNSCTKQ